MSGGQLLSGDASVRHGRGKQVATEYADDLDLSSSLFGNGDPRAATWHFMRLANRVWHRSDAVEWSVFVADAAAAGLFDSFHQDPLTQHSFVKPRGYAGDAGLLDLIYDHDGINSAAVAEASTVGAAVNEISWNGPECRAVRYRRKYVAGLLDARPAGSARVLSIAAGNCRELSLSTSTPGRFVALDQDEQSLAEAKRSYSGLVEPIAADAVSLIRGNYDVGEFDLIYSTGLFDYLSDRAGRRLLDAAVGMAATGAEICIANFTPNPLGIGFIESAMDWKLIYRTEAELVRLVESAKLDRSYSVRTLRDPEGTIAYLHLMLDVEN